MNEPSEVMLSSWANFDTTVRSSETETWTYFKYDASLPEISSNTHTGAFYFSSFVASQAPPSIKQAE